MDIKWGESWGLIRGVGGSWSKGDIVTFEKFLLRQVNSNPDLKCLLLSNLPAAFCILFIFDLILDNFRFFFIDLKTSKSCWLKLPRPSRLIFYFYHLHYDHYHFHGSYEALTILGIIDVIVIIILYELIIITPNIFIIISKPSRITGLIAMSHISHRLD